MLTKRYRPEGRYLIHALKGTIDMLGERLKRIRKKRNMTMKHLGIAVGLPEGSAEVRIAQYENGTRTPKADLMKRIANELDVSPNALAVSDLDSVSGVMHTLFVLEDLYRLRFSQADSDSEELKQAIKEWHRMYESYIKGELTQEQYDDWRYGYQ